ncbi:MAG: signal peptidase I [Candidatus Eisenbacteria sp.]|nr:signal peptidase I [Candidatus Eisenbacteria bacterium]
MRPDRLSADPLGRRRRKSRSRETVETLLVALVLFVLLRAFVIQAFRIPSPSMEDTLLVGDFLFISKLDYGPRVPFADWRAPGLREVRAGDVIVFRFPAEAQAGSKAVDYIKRCVAVGGQRVEMRAKRLYVDDELVVEPYVKHLDPAVRTERDTWGPIEVPQGHLFMLGDNRDFSNDSRYWGALPMKNVHGRAIIRYFSWDPGKKWVRFERLFSLVR